MFDNVKIISDLTGRLDINTCGVIYSTIGWDYPINYHFVYMYVLAYVRSCHYVCICIPNAWYIHRFSSKSLPPYEAAPANVSNKHKGNDSLCMCIVYPVFFLVLRQNCIETGLTSIWKALLHGSMLENITPTTTNTFSQYIHQIHDETYSLCYTHPHNIYIYMCVCVWMYSFMSYNIGNKHSS